MRVKILENKCLGAGAIGTVYQALNLDTMQLMAVKRIAINQHLVEPSTLENIQNEIALMKSIEHPNVVQYYGSSLEAAAATISADNNINTTPTFSQVKGSREEQQDDGNMFSSTKCPHRFSESNVSVSNNQCGRSGNATTATTDSTVLSNFLSTAKINAKKRISDEMLKNDNDDMDEHPHFSSDNLINYSQNDEKEEAPPASFEDPFVVINLFMEYLPGGSLGGLLRELDHNPLEEATVRSFVVDILNGLSYLHDICFVCHRDIKADNVLLTTSGTCKLTDFGASRHFFGTSDTTALIAADTCTIEDIKKRQSHCRSFYHSSSHTNTMSTTNGATASSIENLADLKTMQTCVGTAPYMAPEVIQGVGYGPAADIWSIGCTLVELLTGKTPFDGMNPLAVMYHVGSLEHVPTIPPRIARKLSAECRDFISSCLQRDPRHRPSAAQLLGHPWLSAFHHSIRRKEVIVNNADGNIVEERMSSVVKHHHSSAPSPSPTSHHRRSLLHSPTSDFTSNIRISFPPTSPLHSVVKQKETSTASFTTAESRSPFLSSPTHQRGASLTPFTAIPVRKETIECQQNRLRKQAEAFGGEMQEDSGSSQSSFRKKKKHGNGGTSFSSQRMLAEKMNSEDVKELHGSSTDEREGPSDDSKKKKLKRKKKKGKSVDDDDDDDDTTDDKNNNDDGVENAGTMGEGNDESSEDEEEAKNNEENGAIPMGSTEEESYFPGSVEEKEAELKKLLRKCHYCKTEPALFSCDECRKIGLSLPRQFCQNCWGKCHTHQRMHYHKKSPLLVKARQPPPLGKKENQSMINTVGSNASFALNISQEDSASAMPVSPLGKKQVQLPLALSFCSDCEVGNGSMTFPPLPLRYNGSGGVSFPSGDFIELPTTTLGTGGQHSGMVNLTSVSPPPSYLITKTGQRQDKLPPYVFQKRIQSYNTSTTTGGIATTTTAEYHPATTNSLSHSSHLAPPQGGTQNKNKNSIPLTTATTGGSTGMGSSSEQPLSAVTEFLVYHVDESVAWTCGACHHYNLPESCFCALCER